MKYPIWKILWKEWGLRLRLLYENTQAGKLQTTQELESNSFPCKYFQIPAVSMLSSLLGKCSGDTGKGAKTVAPRDWSKNCMTEWDWLMDSHMTKGSLSITPWGLQCSIKLTNQLPRSYRPTSDELSNAHHLIVTWYNDVAGQIPEKP